MISKHIKLSLIIFSFALLQARSSLADSTLSQKLSGRILLQVEANGEAWYVNPSDQKKYYMGRPDDAFDLMRSFGAGITDSDLKKIPVGLIDSGETDSDSDGLSDALEDALGSDKGSSDSDDDGYGDMIEVENDYSLSGADKIKIDNNLASNNKGRIFLQVETNGEAWYVNPSDGKRYFLSRPNTAFEIMKQMGLGITDADLDQITAGNIAINQDNSNQNQDQSGDIFYSIAGSIMNNSPEKNLGYFTENFKSAAEYTLNFLDSEGRFNLGNIMSGAKLASSSDTEKIYSTTISFSGYTATLKFHLQKQSDGSWLLANL